MDRSRLKSVGTAGVLFNVRKILKSFAALKCSSRDFVFVSIHALHTGCDLRSSSAFWLATGESPLTNTLYTIIEFKSTSRDFVFKCREFFVADAADVFNFVD